MRARILSVLTALVVALGLGLVGATEASAGTCTNQTVNLCGKFYNAGSVGFQVRPDYGSDIGRITLWPGQSTQGRGIKDADQFYLPAGMDARITWGGGGVMTLTSTGWKKLTDNFDTYRIVLYFS